MSDWEPPIANIAVDLVVLTVRQDALHLLVIERGIEPYRGALALPGGFVQEDEDLPDAARRELMEETRIPGAPLHLEQLRTYAEPGRDPRGRVISVAYLALAPNLPTPTGDTDAARAFWMPVSRLTGATGRPLAFDHANIVRDGIERARSKLEYTTLATTFCPERFTITELRRVYEVVWGARLDARNFQRKVLSTEGFVVPTGEIRRGEAGRPARLYTRGLATNLFPPIAR
ncbi:NUDIX hydrolase [Cryptosporangium aurantiacum]|uniref:8-oxo-dGTP diphosphatase n=1 Tax=Cryptosporangium aurantiacum TaxID=134849 RepID=A0A1M7R1M4_9ACTN|nr:NUDIX domain-containing protein [Cryptosporangium aurantiacum]SHN38519.1 8-oxo-dGTP diphosphatase [Cryptosporangium aurantiacum]